LKSTRRLIELTLNMSRFLFVEDPPDPSIPTTQMITMGGTESHQVPFGALDKSLTVVAIIYIPAYWAGQRITFVNGFRADFQANWHRNDSIQTKSRHKTGICRVVIDPRL